MGNGLSAPSNIGGEWRKSHAIFFFIVLYHVLICEINVR